CTACDRRCSSATSTSRPSNGCAPNSVRSARCSAAPQRPPAGRYMPEQPASLREPQFALSRHLRDPATVAPPEGLEERRLPLYRRLLYNSLQSLLAGNFPVIRATLGDKAWHALVRAFQAGHRCQTPLFTEIGREFVRWLETRSGSDPGDPAWLAELAHYEWGGRALQISDARAPAVQPGGTRDAGGAAEPPDCNPLPPPHPWAAAYRRPVHRIGPGHVPEAPPEQPTLLLVRRDGSGEVRFAEISPLVFRLLELLQPNQASGRECLDALAHEAGLPPGALLEEGRAMLLRLLEEGTLLGLRGPHAGSGG